jgi:hypothetical protein
MPIINFTSLDLVPEGLKEYAKTDEESGQVQVNVVPNAKLEEFRNKNIDLSRKLEEVSPTLARVKEIAGDDLDAFVADVKGLREIAQRVKDGELKTDDQIEAAVQERLKVVRDGYDENSKSLKRELDEANKKAVTFAQRLDRTRIASDVTAAVIVPESGVRPEALPDVLERAYRLFKIEDDKVIPKRGEATIYGANGADAMTVTEWLVKLRDEAPHYFKGNGGGGAAGGKEDKIGGFSSAQIAGMSAAQKLELANKSNGKR